MTIHLWDDLDLVRENGPAYAVGKLDIRAAKGNVVSVKDTCRKGHPRTPENIKVRGKTVVCLVCRREYDKAHRHLRSKPGKED